MEYAGDYAAKVLLYSRGIIDTMFIGC